MRFFVVALTLFFSLTSTADYFDLHVERKTGSDGKNYFCYSPKAMAESGPVRCLKISSKPNIQLSNNDSRYRFTKLNVEELSLGGEAPKGKELEVTLSWEGRGAGTLSIEGPKGTLLVFTQLQKVGAGFKVKIQNFFDQSLSEQFDRETVFGVSDNLKVEFLTANWLDEVLRPALERYLTENASTLGLSEKGLELIKP